jgi:hypothetical protein
MTNQPETVAEISNDAEHAAKIDKTMRDGAAFITSMVRHMAFSNAAALNVTPDQGVGIALSSLATAVTIVVSGYDLAGQSEQYGKLAEYFVKLGEVAAEQVEMMNKLQTADLDDAGAERLLNALTGGPAEGFNDTVGVSDTLQTELS